MRRRAPGSNAHFRVQPPVRPSMQSASARLTISANSNATTGAVSDMAIAALFLQLLAGAFAGSAAHARRRPPREGGARAENHCFRRQSGRGSGPCRRGRLSERPSGETPRGRLQCDHRQCRRLRRHDVRRLGQTGLDAGRAAPTASFWNLAPMTCCAGLTRRSQRPRSMRILAKLKARNIKVLIAGMKATPSLGPEYQIALRRDLPGACQEI